MANSFNATLDSRVYITPNIETYTKDGQGSDEARAMTLDATTEIKVGYSNKVTSHFVNDETDSTDHLVNNPRTISFSGVISNDSGIFGVIERASSDATGEANSATTYHIAIKEAIAKKTLFAVYAPNIGVISNCAITSCVFLNNKDLLNAFSVSIAFKEIRLPVVSLRVPRPDALDTVSPEFSSAGLGTQNVSPADIARPNPVIPSQTPTLTPIP